jgi:hypothetical protein
VVLVLEGVDLLGGKASVGEHAVLSIVNIFNSCK